MKIEDKQVKITHSLLSGFIQCDKNNPDCDLMTWVIANQDLARAINNFKSKLTSEDTFFFYFSGHGRSGNLIFSDVQVELQSVINNSHSRCLACFLSGNVPEYARAFSCSQG